MKEWIAAGAVWPDDMQSLADLMPKGEPKPQKGQNHWAFQPLVRPPVPAAPPGTAPIDAFLAEKLAAAGLAMNPEADPRTLIRRVSFDLTGLPPSPEEIAAFEDACRAAGGVDGPYRELVDRLLASPHYGERWARHWLDVVRFAESHGFEMNRARPNAWPYRDWVIESLNADKPYDQFVREQLAGDQLGADAATGFLVGGPKDEVGSPDPVLTANQRADELHDMVGTTASAFLGLTVGCARCHDHKFDPIPQADYYADEGRLRGREAWRPRDPAARQRRATEAGRGGEGGTRCPCSGGSRNCSRRRDCCRTIVIDDLTKNLTAKLVEPKGDRRPCRRHGPRPCLRAGEHPLAAQPRQAISLVGGHARRGRLRLCPRRAKACFASGSRGARAFTPTPATPATCSTPTATRRRRRPAGDRRG